MREIKFRGQRFIDEIIPEFNIKHLKGEWIHGMGYVKDYFNENVYIAQIGDPIIAHVDMIRIIPENVGQFTGLLDKNGKEIYEGDIVKSLEFVFSDYGFNTEDGKQHFFKKQEVKYSNGSFNVSKSMVDLWGLEIIGNIHDNPELMK